MGKNVVAFMNMKGGVSKTTLCVNIANTLATHFDKKVLLIDMDPQFNATQYVFRVLYGENHITKYDSYKKEHKTIYQLYNSENVSKNEEEEDLNSIFNTKKVNDGHLRVDYTVNVKKNFDMILGDIELIELQITQKSGIEKVLDRYIELNNLRERYDYILIDSPPTYSFFFISSYLCCDTYMLPVKPDYLSSLGISLLARARKSILDSHGKEAPSLGIIYTLIDPRNNLHVPVQDNIKKSIDSKNIFRNELRYLKSIPEGMRTGRFMLDIDEQDISREIIGITEEFIGRLGGVEVE
ncbi:ParA family protein [Bacillus manliponensis]|uniref:ParA family protein n=1 Tax=Bacillus manliponensis TaxID=574376 RepID=UPI0035110740